MNSLTLKILLTVYILYALLKFFEFFFRSEETKRKGLDTVYVKGGGAVVKILVQIYLTNPFNPSTMDSWLTDPKLYCKQSSILKIKTPVFVI